MTSVNEQFRKEMFKLADQAKKKEFKPIPFYNEAGDCIECVFKPDPRYRERINDRVTIYRSHIGNDIIGLQIKGIEQLKAEILSKMPGFGVVIKEGKIRLTFLIQASFWTSPIDESQIEWEVVETAYNTLNHYAEQFDAKTDFCLT